MNLRIIVVSAALVALTISTAEAKHRKYDRHPNNQIGCNYDNNGRTTCNHVAQPAYNRTNAREGSFSYRGMQVSNRISIPTPAGTWRIARSCGHRLKAYWNLIGDLDLASNWARKFERTNSPGPRVAVVTSGHVMGVIGGGPGAWRVVSFNGDGHHGNVEFTVNRLSGTLVDTNRPRMASR
jgi:hypothetical protein